MPSADITGDSNFVYTVNSSMTTSKLDDHENILMINLLTSLTMPPVDITGDSNFVYILESKVCVSSVNSSITTKPSKLKASMTNRPRSVLWWTHLHLHINTFDHRPAFFTNVEPCDATGLAPLLLIIGDI